MFHCAVNWNKQRDDGAYAWAFGARVGYWLGKAGKAEALK